MFKPLTIEITAQKTIEISTDEYADLMDAKTRLDVIGDLLATQVYPSSESLLVVARGVPTPAKIDTPTDTPTAPKTDDDLPDFLK